MFDLSKLSEKAIYAILLAILFLSGWNFFAERPFMIAGKEYGFSSDALKKRTEELETYKKEAQKSISQWKVALDASLKQNQELKEQNALLLAQLEERNQQQIAAWYYFDTIVFHYDSRSTEGWSNPESELNLKLLDIIDHNVILKTNVSAPLNKIRMSSGDKIAIRMNKWDYQVVVDSIYRGDVTIRIERRSIPHG
jgi:hypothetical protein